METATGATGVSSEGVASGETGATGGTAAGATGGATRDATGGGEDKGKKGAMRARVENYGKQTDGPEATKESPSAFRPGSQDVPLRPVKTAKADPSLASSLMRFFQSFRL